MTSDTDCRKCGRPYDLRENSEPTPFCDECAHGEIDRLTGELAEYRQRIGTFVLNRLEEVKNKIDGVVGYRLQLSAEETEKFIQEIER